MGRRDDFRARVDRLTQRLLPAPPADDGRTVGDLLDQVTDPALRELAESQLWRVLVDPTADEAATSQAAAWLYRSGLFDD